MFLIKFYYEFLFIYNDIDFCKIKLQNFFETNKGHKMSILLLLNQLIYI